MPSLFRRERSDAAKRERNHQIERTLTKSLRTLGGLLTQFADAIEQRRLQRAGYEKQERYLERTDGKK